MGKLRKQYTTEFKIEVVRLYEANETTAKEIESAVSAWVSKAASERGHTGR